MKNEKGMRVVKSPPSMIENPLDVKGYTLGLVANGKSRIIWDSAKRVIFLAVWIERNNQKDW